jgi:hypothetical protein
LTNNIFFHLFAYNGGMDANDIVKYFDTIRSPTIPRSAQSLPPPYSQHHILDRFNTTADGKLNLDGFIQYHLDQATYNLTRRTSGG